ncbi:MAG: hypothetical protein RSE51_08165 [Bacteroidales bacterium]
MISTLIGAGMGAVGGIAGGIASARAANEQKKIIAKQKQNNQAWYDRNYNADYTQRADVQALLTKTKEYAKDRYKTAQASQAVTGATDESLAMDKAQANDVVSDTMTNVAAQASQFKQGVDAQKVAMDNNIFQQEAGMAMQKAQSGANLMSNSLTAAGGVFGSLSDANKKGTAKKQEE